MKFDATATAEHGMDENACMPYSDSHRINPLWGLVKLMITTGSEFLMV